MTVHDEQARQEIEAVNRAFYEAFEAGDFDTMESLWSDDEAVACAHPGAQPIVGRAEVMRGWMALMAQAQYLQFFLTEVSVSISDVGDLATLTCRESVLAADEDTPPEAFAGATAYATNVFRREGGRWRLFVHHSSPVLSSDSDEDDGAGS